jgi:hypothetical protein
MTAAQEADTPGALAGAAWTLGMVQRPAGDTDGALTLAPVAAGLLEPRLEDADDEMRALQLHAVTTAARAGREGDAWRHWDAASAAAERLASLSGAARGMLLRSIARAPRRIGWPSRPYGRLGTAASARQPDACSGSLTGTTCRPSILSKSAGLQV